MTTNSRPQGKYDRSEHLAESGTTCLGSIAFGDGTGGLYGGIRSRLNAGANSGRSDERPAQRGMRQHLSGEGLRRRKEAPAARLGHQGTAAGRHAGGVATGQAGAQHERVLHAIGTDRGRGRTVSQPDGELRLQQRDREVRSGHPGLGGGTGTADHHRADARRHGSGAAARAADRGADQVQRRHARKGADLGAAKSVRRGRGEAAAFVGRDNLELAQSRNAIGGAETVKVYCNRIPFSTATEQHQAAVSAGISERAIYVEGRGAENFDACLRQFRNGGRLGLVGGLRVLGSSRVVIVARVRELKARGVTVFDLNTGQTDETELLNAAIQKINGQRALGIGDPRRPRRMGERGGRAKGIAAQRRRDAIMGQDVVRRLCAAPELNWERCAEILGPNFSASTLRRLYGHN